MIEVVREYEGVELSATVKLQLHAVEVVLSFSGVTVSTPRKNGEDKESLSAASKCGDGWCRKQNQTSVEDATTCDDTECIIANK